MGIHPLGFRPQPLETRLCPGTTRTTAKTYLYGFFAPVAPPKHRQKVHIRLSDLRCPAEAQSVTTPSTTTTPAALATRRPVSSPATSLLIDASSAIPNQGHGNAAGGCFRRKLEHSGSVCPGNDGPRRAELLASHYRVTFTNSAVGFVSPAQCFHPNRRHRDPIHLSRPFRFKAAEIGVSAVATANSLHAGVSRRQPFNQAKPNTTHSWEEKES